MTPGPCDCQPSDSPPASQWTSAPMAMVGTGRNGSCFHRDILLVQCKQSNPTRGHTTGAASMASCSMSTQRYASLSVSANRYTRPSAVPSTISRGLFSCGSWKIPVRRSRRIWSSGMGAACKRVCCRQRNKQHNGVGTSRVVVHKGSVLYCLSKETSAVIFVP